MAKRQATGETKSFDKKFEIDTETFVVVSNFNGCLMVCMFTNQYQQLLELLGKKDKGIPNLGQMRTRRTKCAVMVERLDKGSSIQMRTIAISNFLSR